MVDYPRLSRGRPGFNSPTGRPKVLITLHKSPVLTCCSVSKATSNLRCFELVKSLTVVCRNHLLQIVGCFISESGWSSGLRRWVQVAVQFSGRGFKSHF